MKNKRFVFILIGLTIIGFISISYFKYSRYEIIHPRQGNIIEAVYGLGKVRSNKRFEIKLGVISTVTRRFVYEGQLVDQGMKLIQLDDHVTFRAPFRGTVTYASMFQGETVVPNITILRLEDLNDRYIELSLEQQSILRVNVGQPAKISFESLRRKILFGKVSAIFPRDDEFIVRMNVEGLDEGILPGMSADVTIEIGSINDAILLPLSAIKSGMVTIKREGRWRKLKVDIGHIDGLFAEILNPVLAPQDEIRIQSGG